MPEEGERSKNRNYIWYIVGAAAGLGLYLWYRNYSNNQALTAAQNALANEPSGASTNTTNASGAQPITSTISTLSDWMNQAQTWLDSQGYDAATVQNALQNYSQGTCLSSNEYQYLDKALGQLGMPPDAPFQGLVQCPQQTTATNPPPTPPPTSGPGSAQARSVYDQALASYRAAAGVKGTSSGILSKLYLDVIGSQAAYTGTSGTTSARAAYDQALSEYRQAAAAKASPTTLQPLYSQVLTTQAAYLGHG